MPTTTPASRPSTRRRVTRSSKEAESNFLDTGVTLTLDGEEFSVRAGDLSALDTRELRRQTGYSFSGLMDTFQNDPDVDLVAAFLWLARRLKGERSLGYEEVAEGFGYEELSRVTWGEAGAEELDGSPEASGGDS